MDNGLSRKQKILVVEDEKELLELYVSILEGEGYEVDRAADGEMGYKKILGNSYDLILLDIILPIMDGLQVLDKLKHESKLPNGKIVLLTNLSQDLVMAKALEYNVRGYIVKSDYDPDQLIKEIKNYLTNGPTRTSVGNIN